ncbi:tet methylcytosine dioxygenase 3-like [Arapaima gigas]
MQKAGGSPGPPPQDIYEFSLEDENPKIFLSGRVMGRVSPLTEYIRVEHQQGGLFSLQTPVPQGAGATQKKKRKRCGMCGPCLRKENCGSCSNCFNRKVGHQICKLRKCDQLKKKMGAWEVGFEDNSKGWFCASNLAAETVSRVGSVDGPRRRSQMETGSHDRLEEGVLSLGLTNGASRRPDEEGEETAGIGSGAAGEGQKRVECSILRQIWSPGQGKSNHVQQQQLKPPCWDSVEALSTANEADMESARNLMAFSASAGSLLPCACPEEQVQTAQLYEKFNQEMSSEGTESGVEGRAADSEHSAPEDLNTLQTALSQARHGHKPPNCNCDGPDCPDYLEWLEKKIKLAADDQDKRHCEVPGALRSDLQENPSHSSPQLSAANLPSSTTDPLQQVAHTSHPTPVPCSLAPIPCSPSVLSIAKEKNISLQTAIAIEALTQLSATVPQSVVPPAESSSANHAHHDPHHHLPLHNQNGSHQIMSSPVPLSSTCSSPIPQSVSQGLYAQQATHSWEQRRRQYQADTSLHGQPLCSFSGSTPITGSSLPQQWQQGLGGSCERNSPRNPWMMLNSESQPRFPPPASPQVSGDPMSELKQLLGDTSGKYTNPTFKSPALHHHPQSSMKEKVSGQVVPQIKQEVDSGEYPGSACAAMDRFRMANGQQLLAGRPLSPGSAAIRHATQAALQQHLHHKRNLFSSSPSLPLHPPFQGFQDLRKWWPQGTVAIKQEPKEPKKKKSSHGSPSLKHPSVTGLPPQPGLYLSKPKQIVIKKPKQKASQPTFMPQAQIHFQKPPPSRHENVPLTALATSAPVLAAAEPGSLPTPTPAHSQESIFNSAIAPPVKHNISESSPTMLTPVLSSGPLPQDYRDGSGVAGAGDGSSALQTPDSQSGLSLGGLSTLNPKLEELIRQFEAEFGEPAPSGPDSQNQTPNPALAQPAAMESQPNSGQVVPLDPTFGELPTNASALADDLSVTPAPSSPASKVMDVEEKKNMCVTEKEPSQPSADNKTEQECDGMAVEENHTLSQAFPECPESLLQLQQQQHRVLADPFTAPCSPLPKRMKVESSGGVTVLSTTGPFSTVSGDSETPTKVPASGPSLRGFLESPLRYLAPHTQNLLDTPAKDAQAEFPSCDCVEQIQEKDEGPYYNHLGSGPTVASIRELMENRFGEKGEAIRIEKVIYTGKEGKSSQGCPIAKWVIRRSSEAEKLLCLVRQRTGHHCANAVIIVVILIWEGVPRSLGDRLYRELSDTLTKYGNPTSRRCGLNEDRTCACQGKDPEKCGASFSFGCSWSMYFNGCKYARSKTPRKFRLQGDHPKEEENLRDNFQELATRVAPLYKQMAPQAYNNQCAMEQVASDCRLGLKEGRPFSGVTACMDFCAHAHKDQHNLYNGCTVVCTLTKEDNRIVGQIPDDEQLHVLPLYKVSMTDEFGSEERQRLKMQNGAIQVLSSFRREVRKLPEPAKSCRQRRLEAKKAASEKKKAQKQQMAEIPEKMIKTELRHSGPDELQQGNKAIPKQEVKPTIKTEAKDRFPSVNGALEGYPTIGNCKEIKPYSINNVYSHGYYASGHPSSGPPSTPPAPSPVNGFHPKLPALHYGYYNYSSNALYSQEFLGYEGHNGTWPKVAATAASFDKKPDVQSLQASLGHSYPDHPDQQPSDPAKCNPSDFAKSLPPPARPLSAPSDPRSRSTPVIKQEPMDIPLFSDCAAGGQSRSCSANYSPAPRSEAWSGHKVNGALAPDAWENMKQGPQDTFTPQKQQVHQQHPHQPHQQPQQHPQQWTSFPGASTPLTSLTPSPSAPVKATPLLARSSQLSSAHNLENPSPGPQPMKWGRELSGFGVGLKHSGTAGGFPDKLWSKVGESRSSTPLGLQEKVWKSCGGSAAGSTQSPAPEGLFPDAFQQLGVQTCCEPTGTESEAEREPEEEEVWSDSEHNFLDPDIGGVAVAPAHGTIMIECARRELHATTPLKKPDRSHPTRISLVFYQHKNLNQPSHGLALWEAKMKLLAERALQRQQEAALLGLSQEDIKAYGKKRKWGAMAGGTNSGPGQGKERRVGVTTRQASTQYSTSIITVSPYAFTQLTGPYSCWV